MAAIKDAAAEFLGHKRVAVTGVSRTLGSHGSNVVYKRLRERGYEVFAVNPNADEVEGDRAYWRFVEHRNDDPLLPPGVGWMQGVAGIAGFLFEIAAAS